MTSTTAQWVFEAAIVLIDELNDQGEADHTDTAEYKNKALTIMNILRNELYPYSDTYKQRSDNRRPSLYLIESFDDVINLDDFIAQSVMPYGLAAHLIIDENPTSAAFYQQRYEELKTQLKNGIPGMSQDIADVYASDGGGYYDDDGTWISEGGNGIGFGWTTRW